MEDYKMNPQKTGLKIIVKIGETTETYCTLLAQFGIAPFVLGARVRAHIPH